MASNMYLKFEQPEIGSSAIAGHEKELEILSWSHGFTQPTSPTRGTAGSGSVEQASHSNLSFSKYLDASSSEVLRACWSGKQIGKATLSAYRSSGAQDNKPVLYLEVIMQHVIISNYSVSGGPGDIPVENVSLDYGTIQYNYIESGGAGRLQAMHDLRAGVVR